MGFISGMVWVPPNNVSRWSSVVNAIQINVFSSAGRVYLACFKELFVDCSDEEKGERVIEEIERFGAEVERVCSELDSEW